MGTLFLAWMLAGGVVVVGANSPVADSLPRVFYINLEESADRRAHMESALSSFPGHVERVPAVHSHLVHQPPFSKYLEQQGLDANFEHMKEKSAQRTISCWLSHVMLWERLQSTKLGPEETALILEDDVQFPQNWTQELNKTLHAAPRGWDVLKVCGWGHSRQVDAVDNMWNVPRWPIWEDGKFLYTGSCGYVVKGSTLPNLLKRVRSQVIKDIDVAMMIPEQAALTPEYRIYEQTPGRRLLSSGGYSSTIRGAGEGYYYSTGLRAQGRKTALRAEDKFSMEAVAPGKIMAVNGSHWPWLIASAFMATGLAASVLLLVRRRREGYHPLMELMECE